MLSRHESNGFHCFLQEKDLLAVIGPGNVHRCSGDPIEAGCYYLEAEGAMIEKFRAKGKAELKIDIEEGSSEEQQKTKPEYSVVELPVDFTKESLTRVSRNLNVNINSVLIVFSQQNLLLCTKK